MKLNDASFCDKISDDEYKKECRTNLADQQAIDDALIKMDPIICDQLSTADKKESCKVQVEVAKKEAQIKQETAAKEAKLVDLKNEIQQAGDVSRCKELVDSNQIAACELNLLVNSAIKAKDTSICKQASTEATVKACEKDASEGIKMQEP